MTALAEKNLMEITREADFVDSLAKSINAARAQLNNLTESIPELKQNFAAEADAKLSDLDHPEAGIDYLAKLQQSGNIRMIEKTTEFDKFVKGEIPIWITYDANAYRAKYIAELGDAVDIVIPEEGSVTAPYAISLVKDAPNPNAGKLWLNYILSDEGQGLFAKGFVRPILPNFEFPEEVRSKFLPAADYERAKDLDWVKAAEVAVDRKSVV